MKFKIIQALSRSLEEIYHNPSLTINEIPNNKGGFENFIEEFKKGGLLLKTVNDEDIKKLNSLVKLKNIISEAMWYGLTGLLTVSAAFNYIVKASCKTSVVEMEDKYKKYQEKS